MSDIASVSLGLVLAVATIGVALLLSATQVHRLFSILLGAAAAVYVGGALTETGATLLVVQTLAFLAFLAAAMLSSRARWVLGAAWLLHGGWDFLHYFGTLATPVATWYQIACAAADLVWGAFLLRWAAKTPAD